MKLRMFALILSLLSPAVHSASSISLLWQPQSNGYNKHSLFHTPSEYIAQPRYRHSLITELSHDSALQQIEISLLASARYQKEGGGGEHSETYINEFTLGHSQGNWVFNLGRKIQSWGVGYSFRPLDIIQQTDQQRISRQSLIGQNGMSAEYYGDNSALSLLLLTPSDHDKTIAARYFMTQGAHDLQLVGQYSRTSKTQLGAGGVSIINDHLAWHGSILYQRRYQQQINTLTEQSNLLLSNQNPYQQRDHNDGLQTVVGLNYATNNGQTLIAEYSYDSTVYSRQQWQAIYTLARQQRALLSDLSVPAPAVLGNIAWSALASRYAPRPQQSMMLQWQYDGEQWQPSLNALIAIEDKSRMITLTLQRQFDTLYFDIGIRHFSGRADSFYGEALLSNTLYATFSSEF